jgi:selenocysteine lyase/cysteine desulfurase
MASTSAPLLCQRDLFSIPDGQCYLNSAFMGPLPRSVEQAGIEARAAPIGLTAQDFFEPAERARILCAQLVNADPERVAFVPTVAYATAIVAKNLQPEAGQNVVMLADMFPCNVYAWRNWRSHHVDMRITPGRRAVGAGASRRETIIATTT